jgi:hypothetical protein
MPREESLQCQFGFTKEPKMLRLPLEGVTLARVLQVCWTEFQWGESFNAREQRPMRGAVSICHAGGDVFGERMMKETYVLLLRARGTAHGKTAQQYQMVADDRQGPCATENLAGRA